MNPNPDLILNPPLNPLLGTLVSNLPDLPINNLSFQSLLSATGNHVMHPQFSTLNPWDDQLFANYPPNQMINHPCMSTTSPNYSANYSGNYSAASVNSPPNYAANYATNHSNGNMMSQHNHEYEQLINLCTSSTSVNHNANHSNVGFNYVPNYDNLITSHEELVIKDHMKESLSRANSSSLITLPKPVNNPEILCNSDIINHAALIASRPNDIIRPNMAMQNPMQNPKSRKKRLRSEAASSDSLKGDNPAAAVDPEQEDQSMEDTNRRQQKSKRAKSAEAKATISRDAVAMAAAELSGYGGGGGGGLGLANPNNDRSAACSTITANSWGDSEKPSILGENREMKAAAAGGSGSEEGDSDRPDKAALQAKNSFKIKPGPADPDPPEPPNSDKSAQKSAAEESAPAPAPAPPAQLDYIHVRARRGQATDSHSLAERVRREKIGERMKYLQDLVPGCSKVTGKAMMLDEIINYVQSLQRQVEFLSMKLASVHPNKVESLFQEVIQPVNHVHLAGQQVPIRGLYGNSFHSTEMSRMPLQPDQPVNQVINANATPTISDHTFGSECISQINGPWEDVDIHNIMQMGFAQNPVLLNSGLYHGQLKKEL